MSFELFFDLLLSNPTLVNLSSSAFNLSDEYNFTQGTYDMNVQLDYESWLEDVKQAYDNIKSEYDRDILEIDGKQDLFKYAPVIAAKRKDINDTKMINEMCAFTNERIQEDFFVDPESKSNFQFYFVIAYVQSHIPAGLITEMEGDDIMEYVNNHWNLFDNTW